MLSLIEPVVLAWAHPGQVSGRFMDSVLRVLLADRFEVNEGRPSKVVSYMYVESGPRIASARNHIVRQFLANEHYAAAEWLLMLDADMTFTPETVATVFAGVRDDAGNLARPIVGGLCFGGGHGAIMPTMYELCAPEENEGVPMRVIDSWEPGSVVPVDATGAAFLLIHRSVLVAMAEQFPEPVPWFAESVHAGREFGEDWTFCLKARRMGYPICVNTNAKVGHMKEVCLDENAWANALTPLRRTSSLGPVTIEKDHNPVVLSRQVRRRLEREAAKR